MFLNSASLLQQGIQIPPGLQVGIAADMVLSDEDIGHAALVRHLLEGILDCSSVVYIREQERKKEREKISFSARITRVWFLFGREMDKLRGESGGKLETYRLDPTR